MISDTLVLPYLKFRHSAQNKSPRRSSAVKVRRKEKGSTLEHSFLRVTKGSKGANLFFHDAIELL